MSANWRPQAFSRRGPRRLWRVARQREGGEEVEARAGCFQVGLDLGVAASGAQLPAPDCLGERRLHGGSAQSGNDAGGNLGRYRVVGGQRAGVARACLPDPGRAALPRPSQAAW